MRARSNTVWSRGRGALLGGLVILLLLAWAQAALGVPASPDLLRRARHDKGLAVRIAAFERNARAKGIDAPRGKPAAALPGAPDLAPSVRVVATTGTLRSIALIVDFSDKTHAVPASSFDRLLFGDVFGPSSLRGYYREVSYGSPTVPGLLTLTTEHPPSSIGSGWLRLPHSLAYYVSGGENGTGSYPNNCQKMVEEAVALADPYVDFSRYDNDGDGEVDNLFVIHAGRGAEFTGSSGDIWSHSWGTSNPVYVDGVAVSMYSTEPEYWVSPGDMTTGVYAHEMGHVLGLPDLYDRDYSSAGIGEWSLMAGGSWNGPGGLGGIAGPLRRLERGAARLAAAEDDHRRPCDAHAGRRRRLSGGGLQAVLQRRRQRQRVLPGREPAEDRHGRRVARRRPAHLARRRDPQSVPGWLSERHGVA